VSNHSSRASAPTPAHGVLRKTMRRGQLSPSQVKRRHTRAMLVTASGAHLRLPSELRGGSRQSRIARAAWDEMHLAGGQASEAEQSFGVSSPAARAARQRARIAQERMLNALGYEREEVVARYSQRSTAGLESIALMRY
jgi:hypothetical protein